MTDAAAALCALGATPGAEREAALAHFHAKWRHDPLVLVKWFGVQVRSRMHRAKSRSSVLTRHAVLLPRRAAMRPAPRRTWRR